MNLLTLFFLIAVGRSALVPMDMVEVNVWRQPDLSGKFHVDPDTSIKLPLLGRLDLKNMSLDSLRRELFDRYQSYLGETFITVNFYFRISILGEVRRPGLYYILSNDRLPGLLASAEGATERGNLRKVRVLRIGQEKRVDVERILRKGRSLNDLELMPGDLVIVPRRRTPSWQDIAVIVSTASLTLNLYVAFFK